MPIIQFLCAKNGEISPSFCRPPRPTKERLKFLFRAAFFRVKQEAVFSMNVDQRTLIFAKELGRPKAEKLRVVFLKNKLFCSWDRFPTTFRESGEHFSGLFLYCILVDKFSQNLCDNREPFSRPPLPPRPQVRAEDWSPLVSKERTLFGNLYSAIVHNFLKNFDFLRFVFRRIVYQVT